MNVLDYFFLGALVILLLLALGWPIWGPVTPALSEDDELDYEDEYEPEYDEDYELEFTISPSRARRQASAGMTNYRPARRFRHR